MTTLRNNPIAIRYLSFVKESLNCLSKKHCVENHNAFFCDATVMEKIHRYILYMIYWYLLKSISKMIAE